jgi:hypothetical protein
MCGGIRRLTIPSIQSHTRFLERSIPIRAYICSWRCSGIASTYFETAMSAKSPGPGRAPSSGKIPAGSGATSTAAPLHFEHAILGRTCSITLSCAGTFSSSSVRYAALHDYLYVSDDTTINSNKAILLLSSFSTPPLLPKLARVNTSCSAENRRLHPTSLLLLD